MTTRTWLTLSVFYLCALTSCGDTASGGRHAKYYASAADVPACTESLEQALIYVEGTGFQVCSQLAWGMVDILDSVAPVVSNGTITDSALSIASVTLTWNAATPDDNEAPFDLEYLLVRSASTISTIAAANAATAISDWQMDLSFTDTTVSGGTTYFYNVLVRDGSNNKALYTAKQVSTPDDMIMFVSTSQVDANLGGRSGADAVCASAATTAGITSANIRAFLSISGADEIQDMPSLYSVPTGVNIVSATGNKIADNWADLLDASIDQSLMAAGIVTASGGTWSASTTAGALNTTSSATTCSGFTSNAVAAGPWTGSRSSVDGNWITSAIAQCNQTNWLLCLGW